MIDKIALLRQALSGLQRTPVGVPTDAKDVSRAAGQSTAPPLLADVRLARDAVFERRVRQRIARIDADDPQRRRQALRIIVEASLLKEFGDRLEADPEFSNLVDQVVQTMEEEPRLSAPLDRVLQDLTAGRG